jgi:PAS domain S-box-containing protein
VRALVIGSADPELAEVLSSRGHAVATAPGAVQALQALAGGPTPDLVVVETALGATAAAIRAVRSQVRGENASLLALVAEDGVDAALDAGADHALPVPAPRAHLAAAIAAAERTAARRTSARETRCVDPELYFTRNPYPMWFFDVDTLAFREVNEAAVQKYGWSREEFLRMTIRDIRPKEDVERLMKFTSRVACGVDRSRGWRHKARDGRVFDVEIISYAVTYDGHPCELVLALDVSDRVRAEREVEEMRAHVAAAERLASIGTLAAGVAHEINNPLTFVLTNLAFIDAGLRDFGGRDVPALREALADATEGARRVQQIAADLNGFSRPDDAEVGPIDLSSVVAGALTLAANELRRHARTEVDVAGAPSPIGRAGRLRQVLLNLIVNAAHAIPEGDPAHHVVSVTARADGGRVAIDVSDTGPGVPEELRARIFEPFFTTKPVGKGTGLGLWVCRRAVEELGGEIAVRNRPGGGAVFRVSLPAVPETR